jgi:hypothetical protein
MRFTKKLIAAATLFGMLFSSTNHLSAVDYISEFGGNGYAESRNATNLTPAIALGAIALVAIIAVAVQNSNKGESCHGHNSGHCS